MAEKTSVASGQPARGIEKSIQIAGVHLEKKSPEDHKEQASQSDNNFWLLQLLVEIVL